ncbi:hypoxanthine phosphoribosyltransferase [Aminithiophilus ramosus]|uniref:Hypoxanthine phosphoribosyltransferase n=2 Tax=Synergistales TaxID=649776 RepID=A0A9Q7AL64_9BACT|nr:hypoxanthine phosphoribosyltransferase [Aminithiophilus ramosus]NCC58380.1 hypoxanthine phosphoribosyltransferase [Synergistales bacterium]QTX33500.1 hypoxanthine phosphoribosyltransferase [Aminithiophilus ramosus]QVL37355.1 hypoxanthine phosphoribosyltransferase [Synergistota bacterium]
MNYRLSDVLIDEQRLRGRVREIADEIGREHRGGELIVIGVLKGAVLFLSDLIREMDVDICVKIDFMAVSSYGASTKSSGVVRIVKDLDTDIKGKDVLLVEDIVDSGLTLSYLTRLLKERDPRSLKTCVLLDKPDRRQVAVRVDYRGFSIPDEFVVGYGLDYAGLWRNLPAIYTLRTEA